jgi:hypothetical protein
VKVTKIYRNGKTIHASGSSLRLTSRTGTDEEKVPYLSGLF